jgi:hypothetical protein
MNRLAVSGLVVMGVCLGIFAGLNDQAPKGYTPRRSEDAFMKLALIAAGLLAATGIAYAACVFC